MKKTSVIIIMLLLVGCGNKQIIDTTYDYDTAIIKLPDDEVINVKVKSWKDYDGEQIQITSIDGITYLTSSVNCILIDE